MNNLPMKPKKSFWEKIRSFFKFKKEEQKPNDEYTELQRQAFLDYLNATRGINTEEEFYEFLADFKSGKIRGSSILGNIAPNSPLLNNKKIVLAAVEIKGLDIVYASEILKKDPQVASAAIESNGLSIQYIPEPSLEIIKQAVTRNATALEYVSDDFKLDPANREFLLGIVKKSPHSAMMYLPNFQNDIEFMTVAINLEPFSIEFAGEEIPDEMIVSAAKGIMKRIIEKGKEYKKQGNDPNGLHGFYHNWEMRLVSAIKDIKNKYPDRFKNRNFVMKLCEIHPGLSRVADKELFEDKEFNEKYGNYFTYHPNDYAKREEEMEAEEEQL